MNQIELSKRLGVCSWSLQPASVEELIRGVQEVNLGKVQLAIDPIRENPTEWESTLEKCKAAGIEIASGMVVTKGEDYSSLESIKITGGVVPDEHWDENLENLKKNAVIAKNLGIQLVTFHAGFLPHDSNDPNFGKLQNRIRILADLYGDLGLELGFETGQETAITLVEFLELLERENVGVNFDPANMILYNKGNPIEALKGLSKYIMQCHIKDGTYTKVDGEWGEEVTTGTGEVDWKAFFQAIEEIEYKKDFFIEREAGNQRIVDIISGRDYIAGIVEEDE